MSKGLCGNACRAAGFATAMFVGLGCDSRNPGEGVERANAPLTAQGGSVPDPAARGQAHTIDFDQYSLRINGERVYLWAGEFHYWRLPSPDLWRDVLEKMKAAGFNAANIYFHWGYHSRAPGVYDFSGVRDIDRLLEIAKRVGIYVIARPGPYINAETDGGGFPAWLNRLPGQERSPDPVYLAYADEWLTQVNRILARHQLTDGSGTIILTQVENEFYDGSAAGHAYIKHLVDKFRADGIAVPLTGNHNGTFNSGEGALDIDGWDSYPQGFNCSNPTQWNGVPDYSNARESLTDRPLFFPEYQGGAFDFWQGPGYENCRLLTGPDFQKVFYSTNIAVGSTMQSFYMTFGGTSWGYLPYPGVYTSYDYGAAIDESRQLTSKYDQQKLFGYLLASVPSLTKTDLLPTPTQTNPAIWVRGRVNPDDNTQLYVLRHVDGASTLHDQTHLSLDLSGRSGYTHDDVDSTLEYTGSWTHATGQWWTAGDFQGTESYSSIAGDSVSIAFKGPAVRWISSLDANHGIAAVEVDGVPLATVDTYGSGKQYQQVSYQIDRLTDADHILTIRVTGEKNPAANGSFVVIDAVDLPPAASGEFYASIPQQPGTAITINGRDAKLLLANYRVREQHVVYSTSQLLTNLTVGERDLMIFHAPAGEDGEIVLRYATEPNVTVLSGSVDSTWDAARGDLRLNYVLGGLTKVLVSCAERPDLVLLLTDEDTAKQFWRLETSSGTVLARGPYLIRDAQFDGEQLMLRGDTVTDTTLEVYASNRVCSLSWNGRALPVQSPTQSATQSPAPSTTLSPTKPELEPLMAHLAGPKAFTLPELTWRYQFETPEREPAFDDSGWTVASHATSLNTAANVSSPVLAADEYGFHHGHVWYRGHFTATGTETELFLNGSTGNSAGRYAAWLNGAYLGSGNDATSFVIPPNALLPNQDNVISLLIANMGHDQGTGKAVRGLLAGRLVGSPVAITWRVQGNLGGEDSVDPITGPLNNGGLYGERAGWSLPGYPDRQWQTVTVPHADTQPGVSWYRSTFNLSLPTRHDTPIVLRFEDDPARRYRVQIYLNGWNLGLYVNNVGPQHDFVLPAGLLRTDCENTLALAVWSEDADGGLGSVSLVALGNYRGGVSVSHVESPTYASSRYATSSTLGLLTLAAPEQLERGSSIAVTATLWVPEDKRAITEATVTLAMPEGWQSSEPATMNLGAIAPGQSRTVTWTLTAPRSEQPWTTVLTAQASMNMHGRSETVEAGKAVVILPPAPAGDVYVSDLPFQATNGWGPLARDQSNGEQAEGDGQAITLGTVTYAKGLGAHAPSNVTLFLGGRCTSFTSTVGIDAEVNGAGSVRFRVLGDRRTLVETEVLTGTNAPLALSADVTGVEWLDLVLDDAGDNNYYDHADWADALLHCVP